MKLATLAIILLCIGCSSAPEKKETSNMAGAYKILSVGIKTDKLDTTYTNSTQLKIYTKDYMMYANVNVPDSVSGFGIGSYSVDGDTVTENVIYSANDTVSSDKPATFKLAVQKTSGGYKQFIAGMQNNAGQKFDMTEAYDSVATGATTAVDGAWKLVKRYTVKGKDTTNSNGTQYKTYYAGYIIWGATWKDSLSKTHTGLGFGKFTMPAENKVKESMTTSTYSQVRGHDFDIDLEMMGSDGFKQTISSPDGSKTVEVYERLK
jgi:hypothetical protein